MDCGTPDFPIHHQLPELTQIHVSWVSDATQLSHPLSFPLSSHLQCFPESGYFPMSQFFASGGQNIGVSASTSLLPMNIQDWFPLDGLVGSPCSPRDSQKSSPTPQFKSINSSALNILYGQILTSIHDYWKTTALTRQTFAGKVMSLLFNMLSRVVITSLLRSQCLLISWLQSPSAMILEPPKIKSATVSPSICHWLRW